MFGIKTETIGIEGEKFIKWVIGNKKKTILSKIKLRKTRITNLRPEEKSGKSWRRAVGSKTIETIMRAQHDQF